MGTLFFRRNACGYSLALLCDVKGTKPTKGKPAPGEAKQEHRRMGWDLEEYRVNRVAKKEGR